MINVTVFAPVGGIVSAQTTAVPCAIAVGPLNAQQLQVVNDYEVQVARANSKHTAVPPMPDAVFLLIGCTSPAEQTSAAAASLGMTSTPSSSSAATPTPSPTPSTTSPVSTFTCPPNGLSKDQLSKINDYEVLVARANSKHTPVPNAPDDVAAFLTCQ
jgi:hypothetical protein